MNGERRLDEVSMLKLSVEILGILNDPPSVVSAIECILTAIKRAAEFDAIGIRLRSGDDFPYFVQHGFSKDFLLSENSLIQRGDGGCKDENGDYCLECTCGLVISGKADQANPLFTEHGSAWTNDSLPILDVPADQDARFHPRNRCIHDGYMSIALIPIHANKKIVGLLQLNDRRKDRLSLDIVRYFEGLSASIGVALMRKQAEETLERAHADLRKAFNEITTLQGLIPICAWCKKIRDDTGYWEKLERYLVSHTKAQFTHGMCPECATKHLVD